ncbi:hypothetical protein MKX42_24545 [Paenibacillus sp. FSL R7-0204]|uniref:hypothetical protein n=1 Tax=Paenibacillus sp. FSL R7-0204 TaxID=2921675 RepID=UPI0030F94ED4
MKKTVKYILVFCLLLFAFPSSIFAEEVTGSDLTAPNNVTRDLVAEEKLPTFALVFNGDDQIGSKQIGINQKVDMEALKKEFLSTPDPLNKADIEMSSKNKLFFDRDEPGLTPISSPQALTPDGISVVLVRSGLVVNNTQNH